MLVGKDGHPDTELYGIDEERLALPAKQRVMEILCAIRLLQREGFGKVTPDHTCDMITNAIRNQRRN